VRVWFYPGETYGYEFAYPRAQALKIAKATHQPVLAYDDRSNASGTDADRMASMKTGEVARIDENDRPVSSDAELKESSEPRQPVAVPAAPPTRTEMPVATAGSAQNANPRPARRHLPRTGSDLPLLAMLASLSLAGGLGARLFRRTE
jgi:hypothetical protein